METTKPVDGTKAVLEDRRRRARDLRDEMRLLSRHKKRIKARLLDGRDWPLDSSTGDRADVDHGDVMAPLPDELKTPIGDVDEQMMQLRAAADQVQAFDGDTVPVDPGVLSRRRRDREEDLERLAAVSGSTWTVPLVEARIEEAFRTLGRISVGQLGPREYGNAMPIPVRQMSDLVSQAGNKSLRRAMERLSRQAGPPSTDEIRRMDEALRWAVAYLRTDDPDLAMFVNLGGMWKAWGAKVTRKCKELGIHRQVFYRDRKEAIEKIVAGLLKDGKAPT